MHTLELAGNKIRRSSISHIVNILLRRQLLILKPLESKLSNDKKDFNMEICITKASQRLC